MPSAPHEFYAHSIEGKPPSEWHKLEDHLRNTAALARKFAAPFRAGDWAYLAGLWHDLGKYSEEFRAYLLAENGFEAHIENVPGRVDHSTAGAKCAVSRSELLGHLLAYSLAGHHTGLLDGRSDRACQADRLAKNISIPPAVRQEFLSAKQPDLPLFVRKALGRRDGFSVSFFTRFLFSCLVDADFLDTEQFIDPKQTAFRGNLPDDTLDRMEAALDAYMKGFRIDLAPVNADRTVVRHACLNAASLAPGFFTLTAPTGGGKTLASLAFALRHAQTHGLYRVVYVVPFTTIIEQNAEQFRELMRRVHGIAVDRLVIEHHSNFDPDRETPHSRLACENWDAPLVVTTSVQFYESLFARRTSACRKLHNLAKSVIVLDEAQTLPVQYLHPCIRALRELTNDYGASVVLCTATQPALLQRDTFPIGIEKEKIREIIPEPVPLYRRLKRVVVSDLKQQTDAELVDRLLAEKQALCVVNTRGHARKLAQALGETKEHFHLSALMCPAHRSRTLDAIRARLAAGQPSRVVSTQLIEAGVDIDFPMVFRAMAGLDSIAQAAGRCNRNGRMPELGKVYIFRSEHPVAEQFMTETANCASQVLDVHGEDLLSLAAIENYFKLYYWDQTSRWDEKRILDAFHLVQDRSLPFLFGFEKVAEDFRIIQDYTRPVVIPWKEEGERLCKRLRAVPVMNREFGRQLQRYTVQIPYRVWIEQLNRTIQPVLENSLAILISPQLNYSETYGLYFDDPSATMLIA